MAGRKTLFSLELMEKMLTLYRLGFTDAQVAEKFGVSLRTVHNWKQKHPEFLHSIQGTKAMVDELVENALFQRALGYTHIEEKVFCSFGEIVTHKTIKHYPPDVVAGKFWLMNRQPDRWRNSGGDPGLDSSTQEKTLHGKKSFESFCSDADYPTPFPKQVEMKNFGLEGDDARLILGSRGYGKTDYVVICGIAYEIYIDPSNSKTLLITKSKERNSAMLKEIQTAAEKNGVVFEKANSTSLRVRGLVGKDHSVSAVTIKSVSLRGRHPKRVIMDDPVTPEDISEATRLQVERTYFEVHKLCPNILIIGQPVHRFDLYANLRDKLRKMEVPHGTIPELDHDLEAQRLAGVSEESIQASYYLNVVTAGSTPFDNIKYLEKYPIGDSVAFIDPSFEGGDYTALSIIRSHFAGVAVVGFTWKKAWNHCLDEIVPKLKQFGVRRVAFETNSLGDQPVIMLRDMLGSEGVIGRKTNGNKHSRIMQAGAFAHLIHLSKESDKEYVSQIVKYEYKCKHDDAPDSLASGLEWIGLIRGKE